MQTYLKNKCGFCFKKITKNSFISRNFCRKNFDFTDFAFKNKNESNKETNKFDNNNNSDTKFSQKNSDSNNYRSTRTHSIISTKRINLAKVYQNDLYYFRFDENFEINELRKKYLQLAKQYHPDMKSTDSSANLKFNKLQQSYERLKTFHELRSELINLESEFISEGSLSSDMKKRFDDINMKTGGGSDLDVDVDNIYKSDVAKNNMTKDEFIKQLCKYK
jgi:hypothetical protein